MKKQGELTHKEAVRKALEMLGGKAQLKQIYPVAIKLIGKNTRSVDIKATIRRELNSSPYDFKATPNVEGSWELISFQEEIDKRDKIIERKDEEIEQLRGVRTDCDFIQFFLEDLMEAYKYDRKGLNPIRVILKNRGYNDAVAVLDAWIDEKEDELAKALKKIAERPTTQNIYGDKNEFNEDSKLLKLALPVDADAAEIAMRIAEQQKQIEKNENNKPVKSAK